MSEQPVFEFVDAPGFAEAVRLAEAMLRDGREAELVARLLDEVGAGVAWRRARALDRAALLALGPTAAGVLASVLADDDHAERRNAARSLLAALAAPAAPAAAAALDALTRAAADADADVRVLAASALGESGNPAALVPLQPMLRDASANVASAAADALGVLGEPSAWAALAETAADGEPWRALTAIVALGRLRDARALPALSRAAGDALRRDTVIAAIGEIGHPAGLDALRAHAADAAAVRAVHAAAARILARRPDTAVPDWLRASVRGREQELQSLVLGGRDEEEAARLLGIAGTPAAVRALIRAIELPGLAPAVIAALGLAAPEVAGPVIAEALAGAAAAYRAPLLSAMATPADRETVERVAALLGDVEPGVRSAAAELLARAAAGDAGVVDVVAAAAADPRRRLGAVRTLARIGEAACAVLAPLLDDDDAEVRVAVAEGLTRCAAPAVAGALTARLRAEPELSVVRALLGAVAASARDAAVGDIAVWLSHDDAGIRFSAVDALGTTRSPDALAPLTSALADASASVRAAALRALGRLEDPRVGALVAGELDAEPRDHRRLAARTLARLAPPALAERLHAALADADAEVRLAAVRALRTIGDAEAAGALERTALAEPDSLVRREAAAAARALRAGGAADGGGA